MRPGAPYFSLRCRFVIRGRDNRKRGHGSRWQRCRWLPARVARVSSNFLKKGAAPGRRDCHYNGIGGNRCIRPMERADINVVLLANVDDPVAGRIAPDDTPAPCNGNAAPSFARSISTLNGAPTFPRVSSWIIANASWLGNTSITLILSTIQLPAPSMPERFSTASHITC
jgi:hypothetical protein